MMKQNLNACIVVLTVLVFAGCAPSINQANLVQNEFSFNEGVVRSWNEQMLLNLVRLRYRDNPLFLEAGSIVSSQSAKVAGNIGAGVNLAPQGSGNISIGASGELILAPTVTYIPLQGEAFSKRLLTPIPLLTIFLLSQSGWSLERLMLCCVQEANDVENAIGASGPTPEYVPEHESFQRLCESLRQLQLGRHLLIDVDPDGQSMVLSLRHSGDPAIDSTIAAFKTLLGLGKSGERFRVVEKRNSTADDEIVLVGRSLSAVMYFLSQSVEVPPHHEHEGKVTVTKYPNGQRLDWSTITGKVMRIRSSDSEPVGEATKIKYRGTWFFIADDDLNSKTTFNLLSLLFNLQAVSRSEQPLLTFPVR